MMERSEKKYSWGWWMKFLRVREWYDSKVPMLLLPAMYGLIMQKNEAAKQAAPELFALLALMIFDALFLAFGYLINDYADWEVDLKAGKQKVIQDFSKGKALVWLWVMVIAGAACVWSMAPRWETVGLLAVIYFFGASYSARPLRFKERGVWGLLVSSTAQRCFPLLLVPVVAKGRWDRSFWTWVVLSFLVGLRYILVHQYLDAENDERAGVKTFALHRPGMIRRMIVGTFLGELLLCAVLLVPICEAAWGVIPALAAYGLIAVIRWRGCRMVYDHGGLFSFDQVPLEDFYNLFLPYVFTVLLMRQRREYIVLLVLWVVFLLGPSIRHLRFPVIIFRDYIRSNKRKRESKP